MKALLLLVENVLAASAGAARVPVASAPGVRRHSSFMLARFLRDLCNYNLRVSCDLHIKTS